MMVTTKTPTMRTTGTLRRFDRRQVQIDGAGTNGKLNNGREGESPRWRHGRLEVSEPPPSKAENRTDLKTVRITERPTTTNSTTVAMCTAMAAAEGGQPRMIGVLSCQAVRFPGGRRGPVRGARAASVASPAGEAGPAALTATAGLGLQNGVSVQPVSSSQSDLSRVALSSAEPGRRADAHNGADTREERSRSTVDESRRHAVCSR